MLLLVGVELTKFARDICRDELVMMVITAVISLLTNMATGFMAAITVYHPEGRN